MTYRGNFFFGCTLTIFESVISFLIITIIYSHIRSISGWSYEDTLVLTGINMLSISFGWLFYRGGLSDLDRVVNRGDFDWMLVKPIDTQFLSTVNRIDIEDGSRSLVGFAIIVYGMTGTKLFDVWYLFPLCIITFLCGQVVLYAVFLIFKTVTFKSIQGWATNGIAHRFQQLAQYPTDIYKGIVRVIYTYMLPLIFVATVPAKILTGKFTWQLCAGSLIAAILSFIISRTIWKFAVKKYSSASS